MKTQRPPNKITIHHIVPQSRGYDESDANKAKVSSREHDLYHQLFINRTPTEIIDFLVKTFWNGQTKWVKEYIEELRRLAEP